MIYIKDDIAINTITLPGKHNHAVYNDGLIPWVDFKPEKNGVLENNFLLSSITREVQEAVNSKSVVCLRSWWIVLAKGEQVPEHSHRYQTNCRTISGCLYIDGKSCPLWIKEPAKSPRMIENKVGRLILFDGFVEHWTEPYQHDTTRYTIGFDFLIEDQSLCDCKETQTCNRCIQNKLAKMNITTYSGGTTSTELKNNQLVKNPYLGKLQHK